MTQHYFVVFYDTETDTWLVDDEVMGARFPNGGLYDGKTWRMPIEGVESDRDWGVFIELIGLLANAVKDVA